MTAREEAVRHVAQSSRTRNPRDLAIQTILIRSSRTDEERAFAVGEILAARAEWLTWLTITQRRWQQRSRRNSEFREKYVRYSG